MKLNFLSIHAPEDNLYSNQLKRHLSSLVEEGHIDWWDVNMVPAGMDVLALIRQKLETTKAVVILLSADFVASDQCESIEQLVFNHQAKYGYTIIPVLLRPCLYGERYRYYSILPDIEKAITDGHWSSTDEAFTNVASRIAQTVRDIQEGKDWQPPRPPGWIKKNWQRYRWLILGLAYIACATCGIKILLSPKKNLESNFQLLVTDIRFTFQGIKEGQLFADLPKVQEAQIRNFEKVTLPLSSFHLLEADSFSQYIPSAGNLTLKPRSDQEVPVLYLFDVKPIAWEVPQGNHLWLSKHTDRPFFIESSGSPLQGKFIYQDSVELYTENCQVWDEETLRWSDDLEAVAKSSTGILHFSSFAQSSSFFLDIGENQLIEKSILIENLDFTVPSNNETAPFKSTIQSGSIEIGGLPAKSWENNSAKLLRPQPLGTTVIHQLKVLPEGLELSIGGLFEAIYAIEEDGSITNMHPPLIIWLWTHHKLQLFLYFLLIVLPLMIGGWLWKTR